MQLSLFPNFSLPQRETLDLLSNNSPSCPPSQTVVTSNVLSISIYLLILGISYKWNRICLCVWLILLHIIFKIYLCCSMYQSIISLYGWIMIFLCLNGHYMDIDSLICDGHIDCLHLFVTMNIASGTWAYKNLRTCF